uniref:Golgin A4 n=1 Tax=Takifugu rubripes TaxID=31033 RepID=A0A674N2B0_TAKRU
MRREVGHLREAYKEVQLRRTGCQARNHLATSQPHRSQLLINCFFGDMFKKLKQKINEEQSPQRNAQSPQQAQLGVGERRNSQTFPFNPDGMPSPSDREVLAGMIAEPAFLSEYTIFALDHSKRPKTTQVASVSGSKGPARSPRGSINGDESASPYREETQSFAQKLQLKVPSMESLIRSGASRAENLFRSSSKENLVRSSSHDSLTPLGESESQGGPTYDPPSDIESEAEEPPGTAEALSKEQLLHRLLRVERSLGKYRGKYSELVTTYRTVQRDKEKTQAILSQSQDKALRRIGELREELQMDQQAKKHLQEEFDAALEEKDQMITVLQTQVALLKKRTKGLPAGALEGDVNQAENAPESSTQSPSKDPGDEPKAIEGEGNSDPAKLMEALQKRVKRQENLLQKCKEVMHTHKERSAQLSTENETLQEQLQERLQELEKIKELHTTEKTKLITQLGEAKNLIEQLEQDKGMVIAETKRQMHETLEMKEDEVAQLRSRLQQVTAHKEELQEQKEKAEKSAFEELERALGVAQRAEEARKQLQVQLEEQVKEVERASEEERKSLQQELTRVKQEVVTIMKKSSEETMANMEKVHSEALAAKEEEISARIDKAVEQCKEEFAQVAKEQEQQASLALEDVELQKTALRTEADNRIKEIQLELEAARTRILELESTQEKISQEESKMSHEISGQVEELKDTHREQISALEEKHQEQLGKHTETLIKQHNAALEELKEEHRKELEDLLRDKEQQLQGHIEELTRKTAEKMEATQAELDRVSTELSEASNSKRLLEERALAAEDACRLAQEEHEKRFQEWEAKHNLELTNIKREHEESLGGMEKTLKEEVNALKIVLGEKQKEIEELTTREKTLKEESREMNVKVKELEELQQSLFQSQQENERLKESNAELRKISENLDQCKKDHADLEHQLDASKNDCQQKDALLEELQNQLHQNRNELSEKEKSFTAQLNAKEEEQTCLRKQLEEEKAAHEEKMQNTVSDMEAKVKALETKLDKFKQKAKDMHESAKKKLQKQDETMKVELEKKDKELQLKEQQIQEKIIEMAQKSSEGLSSAVTELQIHHKEELEKLRETHRREVENLELHWNEKLRLQVEEITEKHSNTLQEKVQELGEISHQLSRSKEENEQVSCETRSLKEDLAIRDTTVQKLQEELNEAAVKLESLSRAEVLLKEQMESVERNLNQALSERNSLQDQLNTTNRENEEKLKSLSHECEEAEAQIKLLQGARSTESEDLKMKLEDDVIQLQAVIANKEELICTLEENLRRQTEENKNLCISVDQLTAQVNAQMEQVTALTQEKESHALSLSENVQNVEELREANRVVSESAKANESHISKLESIISDLKTQLESSINEKEKTVTQLMQQYTEERQQAAEAIERLEQERRSASEQADALRVSLSDYQRNAETRFSQNDGTITSLQARLQELEREISEKNEAVQWLTASIDNQSISKSEQDQVLSEKDQKVSGLTSELDRCVARLGELEEQLALKTGECEQVAAHLERERGSWEKERNVLSEQLQQTQAQHSQSSDLEQEMREKLGSLEEDNQKYKHKLGSEREEFQKIKDELIKEKEESLKAAEEKLSAEVGRKVSELKKKAEQKISQIRKQLTSQLEEKEQTITALQASLEEVKNRETSSKQHTETLEEKIRASEEALAKLKEDQEKQLEEILSTEKHQTEKSLEDLKNMYEEKLSVRTEEHQQTETSLHEVRASLKDILEQKEKLEAEINRLKEEIQEKDSQLQNWTQSDAEAKVERSSVQQTGSAMANNAAVEDGDGDSMESLKDKLSQMKNEKDKIHKDFTRLQKDIRSLRKEHEQDLEFLKKELMEENEKKLRVELEDMQMKHNSAIKQVLREFNTKEASKETEIDSAVKEAIAKAQVVEAELIDTHRDEVGQLKKLLTQKDEELQQTVQKYEEVLQSREQEMGDRVWQVQKELEELQERSRDNAEIHSLEDRIKCFHRTAVVSHLGNTLKDSGFNSTDVCSETTEIEYLRKVLFEYMMGRETKTMAKVITSILKFPPDQAQKVLEKEDSKVTPWLQTFNV